MTKNKTLVLGASENPTRYSNKAAHSLLESGREIYLLGRKKGEIKAVPITTEMIDYNDVHTVTMYLNPKNQEEYYDYIKGLKPVRVIFNPGTENLAFMNELQSLGIECLEACTLVMLAQGIY